MSLHDLVRSEPFGTPPSKKTRRPSDPNSGYCYLYFFPSHLQDEAKEYLGRWPLTREVHTLMQEFELDVYEAKRLKIERVDYDRYHISRERYG